MPEITPAIRIIALLAEVFQGMAIKQIGNVIALKLDDRYSISMTLGAEATTAAIVSETKAGDGEVEVVAALNKSIHRMALRNDTWDDFVGWVSLAKTVYDRDLQRKLLYVKREWRGLSPGGVYEVGERNTLLGMVSLCRFDMRPADGEPRWIMVTESALGVALNNGTVKYQVNALFDGME